MATLLDCEPSVFVRTTTIPHHQAVQHLWTQLESRGFIYKGTHQGWYAVADEAFYTDKQVCKNTTGEMVSVDTNRPVEWIEEDNYKFRLSALQSSLIDWLKAHPTVIHPPERYNEVMAMLSEPLHDLSISRPSARLSWGIPVPGDDAHVVYVWLDALTSYLTTTGYPSPAYTRLWPASTHVLGKDILKFHAVYWPAFLMAADIQLPKRLLVHAHWTMQHEKMSKSLGNVVTPQQLFHALARDADHVRYVMCYEGGMANDHDFSIDKMKLRYRKSLLGQYGNLLERITSLKLCPDSTIHADVNVQLRDGHLRDVLSELPMQVESDYEQGEVAQALRKIAHALVVANQYVSHNQPWHASHDDRQSIVYHASEATRLAALLLSPVTPTTSLRVLNRLGIHDLGWKHAHLDAVKDTRKVVQNGLLFPKLD